MYPGLMASRGQSLMKYFICKEDASNVFYIWVYLYSLHKVSNCRTLLENSVTLLQVVEFNMGWKIDIFVFLKCCSNLKTTQDN